MNTPLAKKYSRYSKIAMVYIIEAFEVLLQAYGIAGASQAERSTIVAVVLLILVDVLLLAAAPFWLDYRNASMKTMRICVMGLRVVLNLGFLTLAVIGRGGEIEAEEWTVHAGSLFAVYSTFVALQDIVETAEKENGQIDGGSKKGVAIEAEGTYQCSEVYERQLSEASASDPAEAKVTTPSSPSARRTTGRSKRWAMLSAVVVCGCTIAYAGIALSAISTCDARWVDVLGSQLARNARPQQYFADGFLVTQGATHCGLENVKSVVCRNCGITSLPASERFLARMSPSLETFDVSDNSGISHLPESWGRLKALRVLNLAHTQVGNLPFSLCDERRRWTNRTHENGYQTGYHLATLDLTDTPALKSLDWTGQIMQQGAGVETSRNTMRISRICLDAVNATLESWHIANNTIDDACWQCTVKPLVKNTFTRLKLLDASNNQIKMLNMESSVERSPFTSLFGAAGSEANRDKRSPQVLLLQGNPLRLRHITSSLHRQLTDDILLKGWLRTLFPGGARDVVDARRKETWQVPSTVELDATRPQAASLDLPQIVSFNAYAATLSKLTVNGMDCAALRSLTGAAGWLRGLGQLTTLALTRMHTSADKGNNKCSFPKDAFAGLAKLTELEITLASSNEDLSLTLSQGDFHGLANLKKITLLEAGVGKVVLLGASFEGLHRLTNLDLRRRNILGEVATGTFEGLGAVTELDLQYNHIDMVAPRAFKGLAALTSLKLTGNQISSLAAVCWNETNKIRELHIGVNKLSAEITFKGLATLTSLHLKNNLLSSVSAEMFDGLDSLRTLDLSGNQISLVFSGAFDAIGSLRTLDLSKNRLSSSVLSGGWKGLGKLRELDLHGNEFMALRQNSFEGLMGLTRLGLTGGNAENGDLHSGNTGDPRKATLLSTIAAGSFEGLGRLQRLDLSEHKLESLGKDSFQGLGRLYELNLCNYNERTLITSIEPGTFSMLQRLDVLNIFTLPELEEQIRLEIPGIYITGKYCRGTGINWEKIWEEDDRKKNV